MLVFQRYPRKCHYVIKKSCYDMYIAKLFEIVFFFYVKDDNLSPCLHNIRLYYNIEMLQCFVNQNAHVYLKQ